MSRSLRCWRRMHLSEERNSDKCTSSLTTMFMIAPSSLLSALQGPLVILTAQLGNPRAIRATNDNAFGDAVCILIQLAQAGLESEEVTVRFFQIRGQPGGNCIEQ